MAKSHSTRSCLIFVIFFLSHVTFSFQTNQSETFIVHVAQSHKPVVFTNSRYWYASILRSLASSSRQPKILYTYEHAARGFSARLSAAQAAELNRVPGVLFVVPDGAHQLHTTRTPHFLGLSNSFGLWPKSDYASDIIIGVLDTGIWPGHPSFSDDGLSPVPSSWQGSCESSKDFPASACNRKIIGAKAYYQGYKAANLKKLEMESKSPRDTSGHGTHTASTAAGSVVENASLFEYARGNARGVATKARIAVYKVCWRSGCHDSDILAGMDSAIADGVHVISLSLGGHPAVPYYKNSIAIGAFSAVERGVLVSCSAGNKGPQPSTVANVAPWLLTVGASTIDREFPADVVLGDGRVFHGVSLYSGDPLGDSEFPLVYGGYFGSGLCKPGDLDSSQVGGKIVICHLGDISSIEKGNVVKLAGGIGMILINFAKYGENIFADSYLIPATAVSNVFGQRIIEYVKSTQSPTATIVFRGTVIGAFPAAPKVAAFSSRGPNYLTPEILKPDVIAPGVNILAGWTGAAGPSKVDVDHRRVEFNIISGTSMSCPHVSGIAALLRRAYPQWTPAALKSALMTTAYNLDNSGNNITDLATGIESTLFLIGSGHVDPNEALDPGLIYDIDPSDYVAFLCAIGYRNWQISILTGSKIPVNCKRQRFYSPGDLNYPSFSVVFRPGQDVIRYTRTVTNVGDNVDAVYEVSVSSPPSVIITCSPRRLEFSSGKRTASYQVTFSSVATEYESSFGWIEWSDGRHRVRSPVAVSWRRTLAASI